MPFVCFRTEDPRGSKRSGDETGCGRKKGRAEEKGNPDNASGRTAADSAPAAVRPEPGARAADSEARPADRFGNGSVPDVITPTFPTAPHRPSGTVPPHSVEDLAAPFGSLDKKAYL